MKTQTVHDPPPKKTPPGWLGREDAKMLNIGSDERSILTLHLQQSNSAATPPPQDLERYDRREGGL
jgi:hypothetical protein